MEIKLTTKQAPFWVYWEYSGNKQQGQVTTCIINQEQTELVRGSVICSKKDRYIKETGRKLSIKKCLDILPFSKEERKEFWNQYHSRIPISEKMKYTTKELNTLFSFFFRKGAEVKNISEIEKLYMDAYKELVNTLK